jgi:hypothetical protein
MANNMLKKWKLVATVLDKCSTNVKVLTHLISRYQLPLILFLAKLIRMLYGPGDEPEDV